MAQIGVTHNQAGQARTKYLDGVITRGQASPTPPRAGMTRLAWVDAGQPMTLDIPTAYVLQATGPNAANPRAPGPGLVAVAAQHFSTLAAGQDIGRLEGRLIGDQIPTPSAGSVMFWWLEDGLAGGIEILAEAQAFSALTAPSIGTMLSGQPVGIIPGTYTIPPDSVVRRLFRTPAGGQAAEVPIPYTLGAVDDGAAFQPIEYPTVFGVAQGSVPGDVAVFLAGAPSLASLAVALNQVTGEATITGTPRQGDAPGSMFLGVQGQSLAETLTGSRTLQLPPGTYTPVGRAVYGSQVSSPITGAPFTLLEQLVVMGDPTITGEAVVGGTLTLVLPQNSGAQSTQVQWLNGAGEIAGATGNTFQPTATGPIRVRVRFLAASGATLERTSDPLTIAAAPVDLPGQVTGLTITPNPAGPGVVLQWQAPTSGGATTDYVIRVLRDDGSTPNTLSADTSVTVANPADRIGQTVQVAARNSAGQEGAAASKTLKYVAGLKTSATFNGSSDFQILWLSQIDIEHPEMLVSQLSVMSGGTAQVRNQYGAVLFEFSTQNQNEYLPTAGLTALSITGGAPTYSIHILPWTATLSPVGVWSVSGTKVGSAITVLQEPEVTKKGVLQLRYGINAYDQAGQGNTITTPSWVTPQGARSAGPTYTIPPEALGKHIIPRVWLYDPLLDVSPLAANVGYRNSMGGEVGDFGPITAAVASVSRTVTQATDATAGVELPIAQITGLNLAAGINVTVSEATDVGNTGGVWIAAKTSGGALVGLNAFGPGSAGQGADFGPLPADTVAIVFGPAGSSGSYSYTLSVSAL